MLFGNDTTDEMCFALFQTVADAPGGSRRMFGSMMRSFMDQWQTAKLSPDARARILGEAIKLFGEVHGGGDPWVGGRPVARPCGHAAELEAKG